MNNIKNTSLLKAALKTADIVLDALDRAYFAHCAASGITPNIEKHTAEYGKKGFSKE